MSQKPRRRRTAVIAAFFMTGAIIMQLGPVCALAGNTGVAAFDLSVLLDSNQKLFGIFNVCGRADVQYVTAAGAATGGVLYTEDDLIFDCPVTYTEVTTTTGG